MGKKKKKKKIRRVGADKKIQKQIYITQELIDSLESDRVEREAMLVEQHGLSGTLSWSANVEAILVTYIRDKGKGRKSR